MAGRFKLPVLLGRELRFPPASGADAEGLVAVGGDFSVGRLLLAYRSGIFPWTCSPPTWWSPDPRAIFELDNLHVPRSLRRTLRREPFRITLDQAFQDVMLGCTEPRPGREETWVSPRFIAAYSRLHLLGHAHSIECWDAEGHLAGGLYGVTIGGLFAGESMFHRVPEASKIALVKLVELLRTSGYLLFDIQMVTPITQQLGAIEIPREEYLRKLEIAVAKPCRFPKLTTN